MRYSTFALVAPILISVLHGQTPPATKKAVTPAKPAAAKPAAAKPAEAKPPASKPAGAKPAGAAKADPNNPVVITPE